MGKAIDYVISGFPRIRSAWLCALLNAHGSECGHDILSGAPIGKDGISDPTIACFKMPITAEVRIYIHRDDSWREAYERFIGFRLDDALVDEWRRNVAEYARTARWFNFNDLDTQVYDILEFCGVTPSTHIVETFIGMKIEQHLSKAMKRVRS